MRLQDVIEEVEQEVADRFDEMKDDENYSDTLHEIADSACPVYNSDIMEIASHDNDIMHGVPECGPAFDGENTPINIAAANIYDAAMQAAHAKFDELKEEAEENEDGGETDEG